MTIDEIELVARLTSIMVWVPAYSAERLMRLANEEDGARTLAMDSPLTYAQAKVYLANLREIIAVVDANNFKVEPMV